MHTKQGNCMYNQNFIYGIQCRKLFFLQSKQMYCFLHVHREKVTERKSQRERNKKRETPAFSNRCLPHQPTAQEASFRCTANQPHTYTHKYSGLDYTRLQTRTWTVVDTKVAALVAQQPCGQAVTKRCPHSRAYTLQLRNVRQLDPSRPSSAHHFWLFVKLEFVTQKVILVQQLHVMTKRCIIQNKKLQDHIHDCDFSAPHRAGK